MGPFMIYSLSHRVILQLFNVMECHLVPGGRVNITSYWLVLDNTYLIVSEGGKWRLLKNKYRSPALSAAVGREEERRRGDTSGRVDWVRKAQPGKWLGTDDVNVPRAKEALNKRQGSTREMEKEKEREGETESSKEREIAQGDWLWIQNKVLVLGMLLAPS